VSRQVKLLHRGWPKRENDLECFRVAWVRVEKGLGVSFVVVGNDGNADLPRRYRESRERLRESECSLKIVTLKTLNAKHGCGLPLMYAGMQSWCARTYLVARE
jgi:hypothetical protein